MAIDESKAALFLNLGITLSLLLLISMADAKQDSNGNGLNCKTNYKVKSGDTCIAVWTKFNLTEKEFRDVNPKIVCEQLVVGQSLCVDRNVPTGPMNPVKPPSAAPQGSPAPGPKKPKCNHFYEVQDGDTCYAIWQRFHLVEEKFEENNPRVVCELLYIGQKLCIDG